MTRFDCNPAMRWARPCHRWLLAGLCAGLCALALQSWAAPPRHNATPQPTWGDGPQVQALAQSLAQEFDLPAAWTRQRIAQAHPLPQVRQLILPPTTPSQKNWSAYQTRFIEPRRIEAGLKFWRRHAGALQRAEQRFGVPAQIVVGIIGVETLYGQHQGRFSVLDVLTTLSLDFPPEHPRANDRQAFFRSELGYFLQQARQGASVQRLGSYAGAMGWPQFMPSSWARHAIDFDGDGHIDLHQSPVDAIGSVAHYLARHGWINGQPTHFQVEATGPEVQLETLTAPDIVPTFSATRMAELGARLEPAGQAFDGPLALVELQNAGAAPSYVAGTSNFYAVTRYNQSSYYAMAVIELGQAVAREFDQRSRSQAQPASVKPL